MKVLVMNNTKNIEGNSMSRRFSIEKDDNAYQIFKENLQVWQKENAIITLDRGVIDKITRYSYDTFITPREGEIAFDSDYFEYIHLIRCPVEDNRYIVDKAYIDGIEYNGTDSNRDLCLVAMVTPRIERMGR